MSQQHHLQHNIYQLLEAGFTNLYVTSKFQEAIKCFDHILQNIDANNIEALYHKGVTLYVMAQFNETIQIQDRVLSLDPNYYWAYVIKGNALNEQGEFKLAMETFQKCINLTGENFDVVFNASGNCFFLQENYERALTTYNRAIELSLKNFTLNHIHQDDVIHRQIQQDQELSNLLLSNNVNNNSNDLMIDSLDLNSLSLAQQHIVNRYKELKWSGTCLTMLNKGLTLICSHKFYEALQCFVKIVNVTHALVNNYSTTTATNQQQNNCHFSILRNLQAHSSMNVNKIKNNRLLAYDNRTAYCIAYSGIAIICEALASPLFKNHSSNCNDNNIMKDDEEEEEDNQEFYLTLSKCFFQVAQQLVEDERMKRELLYFKGEGLRKIRDHKEGINCFTKGLELNPKEVRSMIGLGRVYMEMKNYKLSRFYFQRIIDTTNHEHPMAVQFLRELKTQVPIPTERMMNNLIDISFNFQ
ncbi:hypothetical protein ABK040_010968 [Willaertia magna]